VANLSKTQHINFYQNRSSIVEVMIKKNFGVFMPHSVVVLVLLILVVLVLVLLEDIILNCLSLTVVLMCGSIVLLIGLSISGTACQVILLMLV